MTGIQQLPYKGLVVSERYAFEESYVSDDGVAWTAHNRWWVNCLAAVYILLVFSGKRWMADRPAYRLKPFLILWNILLAGFSIIAAYRSVPILVLAVWHNGWYSTICHPLYYDKTFMGIWGFLFTLSKLPELVDTVFIILRKQKLIFLHWFHHASVLIFVFAVYGDRASFGVWFSTMNYFVHSIMYTYYGIRAAGIRLPRWVSVMITMTQILQMILGTVVVGYAASVQISGVAPCNVSPGIMAISVSFYFSYLVLFAKFFKEAYLTKRPAQAKPSHSKQSNGVTISRAGDNDQPRKRVIENK